MGRGHDDPRDMLVDLIDEQLRALHGEGRWTHVVQCLASPGETQPAQERFNPRPAGVMRPGSTTEKVYQYLHNRPGPGWVTRQMLMYATQRSGKAVDWALLYLRSINRIESQEDPRCSRYFRYRAKRSGAVKPFGTTDNE